MRRISAGRRHALLASTILGGIAAFTSPVYADKYWDGSGPAGNNVVNGGAGTWSNNGLTWTDSSGAASTSWNSGFGDETAIFQGTGGTVTVQDTVGVTELQFKVSGYTLSGGTLVLSPESGPDSVIDVASGVTTTISTAISGGAGLRKTGGGILTLRNVGNDYAGGTFIDGGTLQIRMDSNLGAANGGLTFNGGTLETIDTFNTTSVRQVTLNAEGTFKIGQDSGLSLTGVVSGDGKLIKTGKGTLRLYEANTYAGGTQVVNGTLVAGKTGALGAGPVEVDWDGVPGSGRPTLWFQSSGDEVSAGELEITVKRGDVNFGEGTTAGTAQIILAADQFGVVNFYKGSTAGGAMITNDGGTLNFEGAEAGSATIANDGTGSKTVFYNVFGGPAADLGSATITNSNGGYVSLQGNTDGGSATIINKSGGSAYFEGSAKASGATVENQAGGQVVVRFRDEGDTGAEIGSLFGAGAVVLGEYSFETVRLEVGALDDDDEISGVISASNVGAEFVKTGTGMLTLTGDSSAYTAKTAVEDGILRVNGKLGGTLDVRDGGRLEGTGTVGTTTVNDGATVAAGNSTGTLKVNGDITFEAGSKLEVEATNVPVPIDLIEVTGTATLEGGLVNVLAADDIYMPFTTYTILTATTGVEGEFASVTDNLAFLDPSLSYDANNVYLTLARNDIDFASYGRTANQKATSRGIDSLGAGNALYLAFVLLEDDAPLIQDTLDQLSGEIHGSLKSSLLADSHFLRDAVTARLRSAARDKAGPAAVYSDGAIEPAADLSVARKSSGFWMQGFGSWGDWDGDGNAATLDRSTGGAVAGVDTLVGDWRLGVAGGYSQASFDVDDRRSSGDADGYHAAIYAGTNWDNVIFRAGAAYSWSDVATERRITSPIIDELKADYGAGTAQVFGELAYAAQFGGLTLEPFANAAYVNLHTEGFTEEGGAAALHSKSSSSESFVTTLGLRPEMSFGLGDMETVASATIGWQHAFGDVTPETQLAFEGGEEFGIRGVPMARDTALVEAGLAMKLTDSVSLGASYQGQFGDGVSDNGFNARLGVEF
ncbi:MAG: autotransporter domain-containing protein [Pseudomonadota bacterium]